MSHTSCWTHGVKSHAEVKETLPKGEGGFSPGTNLPGPATDMGRGQRVGRGFQKVDGVGDAGDKKASRDKPFEKEEDYDEEGIFGKFPGHVHVVFCDRWSRYGCGS